jgi:hypothetical protein
MHLYECDVDSATYWIVAGTVFEAHEVLRKAIKDSCGDIESDVHSVSIDQIGERYAQKVNFRDDEENTTRTMWQEFQRDTETPRLLACSEY